MRIRSGCLCMPVTLAVLLAAVSFGEVIDPNPAPVERDAPEPVIVLPCEVIEWHDGDTGTVRVTIDVRVRLLDCWAPEVTARKLTASEKLLPVESQRAIAASVQQEKQRGLDSWQHLKQLAPGGVKARLEIPLEGKERSDDLFTMGRVLGRVWVGGKDLSTEQVESGYATRSKAN